MTNKAKYDLNLKVELIPEGRKNRPGDIIRPTFITIHNTDNVSKGADAGAHSGFVRNKGYYMWQGRKNWVSWHYTVDDQEMIKQLPVNEVAYHAKSGNSRSVAIEQCMHQGIDVAAADERLCQLVAQLRLILSISRHKVVPHKYWTGKNCPSQLIGKWETLQDRIDEIIGKSPQINDLLAPASESADKSLDEISESRRLLLESFEIDGNMELFD